MSDAQQRLRGVPTQSTLTSILDQVRDQTFDRLVITGDLAHDEQAATYAWLRAQLDDWLDRCRLVPGNHDNRSLLRATFPEHVLGAEPDAPVTFRDSVGDWQLIGLDTQIPGSVAGNLGPEQLTWLRRELAGCPGQPTIIWMHHPPVPIGSEWLDALGLQDPTVFQEIIAAAPHVRLILAGHVHQEFSGRLEQAEVWTTPSAGVQFVPRAPTPTYDALPPGYRLLQLEPEAYQTQVIRLAELEFPPDANA